MRLGHVSVLALAPTVLAVLAGCADASGRFQQFEDRRPADAEASAAGASGAGGEAACRPPAPGIVHGPALLAIETKTTPGAAILFWGEVETPELAGQTAVKYSYQALDLSDRRTQVGDALVVGPYAIADDGTFDAPTAESTLPGSANALLPGVPITSQLTLHGTICGVSDFYCGTVTGNVTAPIKGPTSGQFGLLLVPSIDDIPERPRYGCAEDALAQPLEPTSK
jgi:hypothetical protein